MAEQTEEVMNEKELKDYVLEANRSLVERMCKQFVLNDDNYRDVKDILMREIDNGLCKYTHNRANVKCYQTHVQTVPTGCETGKFLALDLGGTKFRVLYIYIDDFAVREIFNTYHLPQKLLVGPGVDLFDYFAECLSNFIYSQQLENEELPLGFTFSFPLKQVSIDKGILVSWTKGFNCPGVVGRDVVALLSDAIDRRGDIMVRVVAITNDTTGTLITTAWKYRHTKIGVIVGTGTNACYMEKTKNITMYEGDVMSPSVMIVNTEWGALGDNGVIDHIRTKYDRAVDSKSLNPNAQTFEKMISGLYLGELTRLLLIDCIESGAMLNGIVSEALNQPDSFSTKNLSEIEKDADNDDYLITKSIFNNIGYPNPTDGDCENLRYICSVLMGRSAQLVGAALACLIDRVGDPFIVIGADGSLFRFSRSYYQRCVAAARRFARPEHKFEMIPSEDGSGRGAALIAAIISIEQKKAEARISTSTE